MSNALKELHDHLAGARAFLRSSGKTKTNVIYEHLNDALGAASRAERDFVSMTDERHRLKRQLESNELTIKFLRRSLNVSITMCIQGEPKKCPSTKIMISQKLLLYRTTDWTVSVVGVLLLQARRFGTCCLTAFGTQTWVSTISSVNRRHKFVTDIDDRTLYYSRWWVQYGITIIFLFPY